MNHEALLDQIYSAVADPARWPEALVNVADHLGCIGGQLVYNAPPGAKSLIVLGRLDPQYTPIFHKHYVWNPWTLAIKDKPFGQPIVLGSLVDRRVIHKTGFYADVLAPQEIQDMAVITHRALAYDGGLGGIGFALSAQGVDRAEQVHRRLGRLAPHLCRALDASLRLAPLVDGSRQLARVLQLMPNAALLLNARCQIIHANPAAELLLRNCDGLTCVRNGGLHLAAVLPDESADVSQTLARAARIADGTSDVLGEPLRVTRLAGGAPLLVIPVPLPPPAFALWDLSDSARVLVLVIDPGARHVAAGSTLQTTFGLTHAEARVATLVGSGLGGPQTAQALGISPMTVKTHLARCFEKMGIGSQVELARLLSALPVDPAIFNQGTAISER